jgi:hypothetical protein
MPSAGRACARAVARWLKFRLPWSLTDQHRLTVLHEVDRLGRDEQRLASRLVQSEAGQEWIVSTSGLR